MQKKKWILLSRNNRKEDILAVSRQYGLPPVIATILLNRGVQEVETFIHPSAEQLPDPFLMKGMEPGPWQDP